MVVDDTDSLARQRAVTDIRAFLSNPVFGESGLAAFVNTLSQRYGLDVGTARSLFVAEAKRAARSGSLAASHARSTWRRNATPSWTERPTAEYPLLQDSFDDEP
ncbi:MAG: hypothetical protein AAF721_02570 [Myxococcota bacterium]